jgi:hypothetical protein
MRGYGDGGDRPMSYFVPFFLGTIFIYVRE